MFHTPAHKQTNPAALPAQLLSFARPSITETPAQLERLAQAPWTAAGWYYDPLPKSGLELARERELSRPRRLREAEARGDWQTANTLRHIGALRNRIV